MLFLEEEQERMSILVTESSIVSRALLMISCFFSGSSTSVCFLAENILSAYEVQLVLA